MVDDETIQENVLEKHIHSLKEQQWVAPLDADGIIDTVSSDLGVDVEEVVYNIKLLDDNFCIDHQPSIGGNGTTELKTRGVEEYEDLSDDVVVPLDDIAEVLTHLDDEERQSPRSPNLSRDELLDNTDLSEEELDVTVWYLCNTGHIEARTSLGTPVWISAKIERRGRETLKKMDN
jgi:hypothetical protein